MAQCLSNFPTFPQRISIPNFYKNNPKINTIKVKAAEENLDHLQRVDAKQQAPLQEHKQPIQTRFAQSQPIGLWDRFPTARTVAQMMDTMERLMEDPLLYGGAWGSPLPEYGRGRTPWEIKEGEGEYRMRFDMPGMTKEDVKVWVEEKMLVLKAEKYSPEKKDDGGEAAEDGGEWRSGGKYSYRISLPENVEIEKIRAEVKDGVLYVTIPKVPSWSKILDINVE